MFEDNFQSYFGESDTDFFGDTSNDVIFGEGYGEQAVDSSQFFSEAMGFSSDGGEFISEATAFDTMSGDYFTETETNDIPFRNNLGEKLDIGDPMHRRGPDPKFVKKIRRSMGIDDGEEEKQHNLRRTNYTGLDAYHEDDGFDKGMRRGRNINHRIRVRQAHNAGQGIKSVEGKNSKNNQQ